MAKIKVGDYIMPRRLKTISESYIDLPSLRVTHLQFRRFTACPICTLHIDTFVERHLELLEQGIQEIVVFHSTQEEMIKHGSKVPFAMIADPCKELYKAFGIESSVFSIMNPVVWAACIKGVIKTKRVPYEKGQSLFGLPADFLISKSGEVIALKYGSHADDHWQVDEVVKLARHLVV